jgi:centrosomal protein CEP19
MNKPDRKFNSHDYLPKRFGLKYNPPQIIIEYLVPSSGKLYHHKIRLNKFKPDTNLQEVIKEIYEKHYMYLDQKKINPSQIVKLVDKLSNVRNVDINGSNRGDKSQNKDKKDVYNSSNKKEQSVSNTNSGNKEKVEINELDDEEEDYYKFFDYDKEDLNKLETEELKKRKEEMDKLYNKNAVLPGDENFVFDVRVRKKIRLIITFILFF